MSCIAAENKLDNDMITQETKPVKTWGGFDLPILKVNLNPLS